MPQNGNDANAENVPDARRGCGEGKGRGAVEFVFVLRVWSRHVRGHFYFIFIELSRCVSSPCVPVDSCPKLAAWLK